MDERYYKNKAAYLASDQRAERKTGRATFESEIIEWRHRLSCSPIRRRFCSETLRTFKQSPAHDLAQGLQDPRQRLLAKTIGRMELVLERKRDHARQRTSFGERLNVTY